MWKMSNKSISNARMFCCLWFAGSARNVVAPATDPWFHPWTFNIMFYVDCVFFFFCTAVAWNGWLERIVIIYNRGIPVQSFREHRTEMYVNICNEPLLTDFPHNPETLALLCSYTINSLLYSCVCARWLDLVRRRPNTYELYIKFNDEWLPKHTYAVKHA